MFNPLTQLNYFFRLATDRKLSGSDQLMYLHIFNKFNQAHWTETLRIKDAELKDLLRLYDINGKPTSIEIVRRGRQRLKAKGFIEVLSRGEGGQAPEYKLPCLYPTDPPADPPADPKRNSYIRVREDVIDVKDNLSIDTHAEQTDELDALLDYWERDLHGGRLSFEHQSKLSALMKERGADWLKAAMKEASDTNNNTRGLSPKFLFSVIARKQGKSKATAPKEPTPKKNPPLDDYETLRRRMLED